MRVDRYVRLCTEEAARGLWFHARTATPAAAIIAVSLLVLGAFLLVADNLGGLLGRWRDRGQVQLFVDEDATPDMVGRIGDVLADSPAVESFEYLGPEEAAERFREDFGELGELLDALETNPLPASFAVTVGPAHRGDVALESLAAEWEGLEGVEDVQLDLEIIERLELGVRAVRLIGLILGGTVLAAAVITTSNVIRVLVVARRQEIEVMRLVGAPEALVRGRFVFEGGLLGLIGGVAAVVLLYAIYSVGLAYMDPAGGVLTLLPLRFLGPLGILELVGCGLLAGLGGALIAFGPGSGLRGPT